MTKITVKVQIFILKKWTEIIEAFRIKDIHDDILWCIEDKDIDCEAKDVNRVLFAKGLWKKYTSSIETKEVVIKL